MAKGPKKSKWVSNNLRKIQPFGEGGFSEQNMDDEIDVFHKERDFIPLDGEKDFGDDSDEDIEEPVFDFEKEDSESDNSEDEDDGDSDDDDYVERRPTSFAAKISRQKKFLREKFGGVEDEMRDDLEEEDDEEEDAMWGRRKNMYYGADVVDIEARSSDEEALKAEEAAAIRMQRERAQFLSAKDFGLKDADEEESDTDGQGKSLQGLLGVSGTAEKSYGDKMEEDGTGIGYEQIKKDLSVLTAEEKMNAVNSVSPELVKLIPELKDSLNQLECKVNPLLCKAKEGTDLPKELNRYLEVKQSLLLVYCQAIGFYLLLKSEGHPIRDHPVIERLTRIKEMLLEMNELDMGFHFHMDEIQGKIRGKVMESRIAKEIEVPEHGRCTGNQQFVVSSEICEKVQDPEVADLVKSAPSKVYVSREVKSVCQDDSIGLQSREMLKVRAGLEEKLKKKGFHVRAAPKSSKDETNPLLPVNKRLETLADFDDEVMDNVARGAISNGVDKSQLGRLSQLVAAAKVNKAKVVSGDDDLPVRDDLGERRRSYELRVLAKAGVQTNDAAVNEAELAKTPGAPNGFGADSELEESEDDFYREAKRQKAAKELAKTELYSRHPAAPLLPEKVDGKRHITYQMEKNKGLTRSRKKLTKIPRKKYKLKHQKAVVRRKGQVREIRRSSGPYGGEVSGINTNISRSIRFKS